MREIKIVEVKSELGAGTRGASMGIDAIKIAALDFGSRFFKRFSSVVIQDENHLLLESVGKSYAKRISGILTVCERVCDEVCKQLKDNRFPLVLAGDHSTALGTIAGVKKAWPKKKLGVIWIDAHADLHSPYTTPSGNVHGMPLAAVLGEDNLEKKINTLDQETINYWYSLKNVGGISPKLSYRDLVYVNVRDMEPAEEFLLKKHGIRNFPLPEIRRKTVERVALEALAVLDHCDMIYVSFDVDCMDASISKGTGTPVPGGMNEREAGTLLARLMESDKVVCLEMVEINPTLDKENRMAENAFEILSKATNAILND
ncbi:MAG TPA: arginase [Luteibaculaceae bacterium]|nr:arginase [Luteibaculaceae bacterium]